MRKGESALQLQYPRGKEAIFPKGKHDGNDRNTDCRSLLDTGKNKGIAASSKEQENRQRVISRISMYESNVAANRQERPEHQEILCGHTVHL